MEGLEEYQDLGDDFWNYDSSEIYNNIDEGEMDYVSDYYLRTKGKPLKERTDNYPIPFTLNEINSYREKLFKKFLLDNFVIHKPLFVANDFSFGKYKGKSIESVFENDLKYIEWIISDTEKVFNLKKHYTFSINNGLKVPILLLNEMKLEYYEGKITRRRKIFNDGKTLKVEDNYYDIYL